MKVGIDSRYVTPRTLKFGTYGSYGAVTLSFSFSKDWDGLVKTVTFYPLGTGAHGQALAPTVILDDTNEMILPREITDSVITGEMVVEGIKQDVKLITVSAMFEVLATIRSSDPAPTPSEMEQAGWPFDIQFPDKPK